MKDRLIEKKRRRDKRDREAQYKPSGVAIVREVKAIKVNKIVDAGDDADFDHYLACEIANSARIVGIIQPIAVRRVQFERDGETRSKIALIAGRHRLAAAGYLGLERIDCVFVESADDAFVRQVQVAEDLFRKHLTVLRSAELTMEWLALTAPTNVRLTWPKT